MARYSTSKKKTPQTVKNIAGGDAFQASLKLELVSTLLTSFIDDQAYRGRDKVIARIVELCREIKDKLFIAKTAVFARTVFGMRSSSHIVAAVLAKEVKGQPWMGPFLQNVVARPDDITEILAAYFTLYGKRPIPNMFKRPRGLASAFGKFDAYQLGKYREEQRDVKLVDAVNLLRPPLSPKNGTVEVAKDAYWKALSEKRRKELDYKKLPDLVEINTLEALTLGLLKAADTWESMLTAAGKDKKKREKVWKQLIEQKRLGYMALLMNLRNIMQDAPTILPKALESLTNPEFIRKQKILPFRFASAYETMQRLSGTGEILKSLTKAAETSLEGVPKLDGKTLIALDVSGSMSGKPFEIGSMFASALMKANSQDTDLIIFSNGAKYLSLDPTSGVFDSVEHIRKHSEFSGTNFHAIFQTASKKYDRIVILSDMQGWVGRGSLPLAFKEYKSKTGAKPKIWSINLNDYGTLMFPEQDVLCLAGWSDKLLGMMQLLESEPKVMFESIEQLQL